MARVPWLEHEIAILIENYHTKTTKELMLLLPGRTAASIKNQAKYLQQKGIIKGYKTAKAREKAFKQRFKNGY